ncbi:hypothetical protein [Paraburkholderia aromaticivorans]|uniref:hypothetical protein n=1 Tax=Paraburkholderia aromaticivorans TaxID=2026199 RepID=UPI001455ECB0|nr:hypothetical protein [Paraburkholderia aromaticivorans]
MKKLQRNIYVLVLATVTSIPALADCRSVLLDNDKAADVRQNLQCLANQVSDLRNQLTTAQAALQALQTEMSEGPHVIFGMHPQRFPNPGVCQTWAVGYLNNNGFADVTPFGQAGAVGKKPPTKAVLLCTPTGELALYLTGPDNAVLLNLQGVFDAAFAQSFH